MPSHSQPPAPQPPLPGVPPERLCGELLGASDAAAGAGDLATAAVHARTAAMLAASAGLPALLRAAQWQQGRLALLAGDREAADGWFRQAGPSGAAAPAGPSGAAAPAGPSGADAGGARLWARFRRGPRAPERPAPPPVRPAAPLLAVGLLGSLSVSVDGVPAEGWHGHRTRSLLAFLLTHRDPWPHRETLMDAFWPDSAPGAARNSLGVAMHQLRQTLGTATGEPVVVFRCGAYRLGPGLGLWLDCDEFDLLLRTAREAEDRGDRSGAAEEYERALALYRGEFLAESPYEEWTVLHRERLRLAHLDALARLSELHFTAGRYAPCAELCRRLVALDPCRETAHRRLMRCLSRIGQPHLAILQFRACVRTLREDLGVPPQRETVELHQRLRDDLPV
ncbi:BTAD domain-containing putative transcriptional regulator [Streptomyces sp. PA03-6a]|nr:BTAD domain-containing putative transcriptional regulator [Streptomyces sp. PA03-6a]